MESRWPGLCWGQHISTSSWPGLSRPSRLAKQSGYQLDEARPCSWNRDGRDLLGPAHLNVVMAGLVPAIPLRDAAVINSMRLGCAHGIEMAGTLLGPAHLNVVMAGLVPAIPLRDAQRLPTR